jgi:hypothetical protein
VRQSAFVVLFNLLLLSVLILAIEGVARVAHLMEAAPEVVVAERMHTRYDELLGWANVPRVTIPNMYGTGAHVSITDRGFRGTVELGNPVPEGVIRIVCSGDSFTFGYGVGDAETWCARIGRVPGFESVNMGQGGYGVDQMYLWYARDGTFDHHIVLFAFIGDDFERARRPRFIIYDKPMLGLSGDSIAPINIPVSRCILDTKECSRKRGGLGRLLDNLSSISSVVDRLGRKLSWRSSRDKPPTVPTSEEMEILRRIFRSMDRRATSRGARLVGVLLPIAGDYADSTADVWRQMVGEEAEKGRWEFWDLTEPLRALPPIDAASLFNDVDGHYTIAGNQWVASQLIERLNHLVDVDSGNGREVAVVPGP